MKDPDIMELMGVIIGDGSLLYNKNKRVYRLEIAGNATEDPRYFLKLSKAITKISNKKAKIRFRQHKKGKSITLYLDSKEFIEYLKEKFKLPSGKKTFTITIPEKFTPWKYSRHIIRGIFESDGSLYFSKSKTNSKYPTYPRIEIITSSKNLAKQLLKILKEKSFNVQILDPSPNKCIKVYISGELMLKKWLKEIGFSSPKNISKYNLWKQKGYYLPRTTLKERESLLNSI